jgi:ribonucleoside-diphosphate reductase beta chain
MLREVRRRSNDVEWAVFVDFCDTIVSNTLNIYTLGKYKKHLYLDDVYKDMVYDSKKVMLWLEEYNHHDEKEESIIVDCLTSYSEIEDKLYDMFKTVLEKDEPLLKGFDTSKMIHGGGGDDGVILDSFFANIRVRERSLALRAIQYMSKKLQASFWTEDEIILTEDIHQLRTPSLWKKYVQNDNVDDLYFYLCHLFLFFNFADGLVGENVSVNMISKTKITEVKNFYAFQTANETVHAETYAKIYYTLLDTLKDIFKNDLGTDLNQESLSSSSSLSKSGEAERVYESRMARLKPFQHPTTLIENMSSMKRKKEWVSHFLNDDRLPYHVRLIATVAVEGIFFSSSFCSIFWLKKRGLMPGLTFSNELISRDEGLHCDFAALVYRLMKNKLNVELIVTILKHATECEIDFVNESMPETGFVGLNRHMMAQYVRFVANRFISHLIINHEDKDAEGRHRRRRSFLYLDDETGLPLHNPFDFMHLISIEGKTNFFERTVSEYRMPDVFIPHSDYFDDERHLLELDYNAWYGGKDTIDTIDDDDDRDAYQTLSQSLITMIQHVTHKNNDHRHHDGGGGGVVCEYDKHNYHQDHKEGDDDDDNDDEDDDDAYNNAYI